MYKRLRKVYTWCTPRHWYIHVRRTNSQVRNRNSQEPKSKNYSDVFTLSDPRNHRYPELSLHRQRWSQLKVYPFLLTAIVHRKLNAVCILCHNYWVLCRTSYLRSNRRSSIEPCSTSEPVSRLLVLSVCLSHMTVFLCLIMWSITFHPWWGQEFSMLEIQTHFGHFVTKFQI